MESVKSFCDRKLLGYTADQYIIMFIVFTIFLPFYISYIAIGFLVFYLIWKRELMDVIRSTPRGIFAILFSFYSLSISLAHDNFQGTFQSLGMLLIVFFILFYRKHINERLFTFIVDACCLLSIGCFVWGLMEYVKIIDRLGYPFSDLIVENEPQNRINSTMYNANFYAMMIQFLVLMCIYKILHAKTLHRVVFYTTTILCNLFALYLTGCRAGWLSFLVTLPLIFYLNHRKKTCYAMIGMIVAGIVIVLMNPTIFPRYDNILEYFFDRTDIWITALKGIQDNFWIGKGPSTYYLIFNQYGGPLTSHSHCVYLDPLLSFGFLGVIQIVWFAQPVVKEIYRLYKSKINPELCGLILCFILTVLIHGIFDYTIFWVQTGVVFLMVFNAGCMYKEKSLLEIK